MMLSGVILVIAFVITALTLAEIRNIEQGVVQSQQNRIWEEYRQLRDRIASALFEATENLTVNASFLSSFNATMKNFANIELTKGHDFYAELAANGSRLAPKTEYANFTCLFVHGENRCASNGMWRNYTGWSYNGTTNLSAKNWPFDGRSDGIVFGNASGESAIRGAIVYLYLADYQSRFEETLVIALNT